MPKQKYRYTHRCNPKPICRFPRILRSVNVVIFHSEPLDNHGSHLQNAAHTHENCSGLENKVTQSQQMSEGVTAASLCPALPAPRLRSIHRSGPALLAVRLPPGRGGRGPERRPHGTAAHQRSTADARVGWHCCCFLGIGHTAGADWLFWNNNNNKKNRTGT